MQEANVSMKNTQLFITCTKTVAKSHHNFNIINYLAILNIIISNNYAI